MSDKEDTTPGSQPTPKPSRGEERKAKRLAYNRQYHENLSEEQKEKARLRAKVWYEANKERHREARRAWYEANKERKKAAQKAWNEANKERLLAKDKAWRDANRFRISAVQACRKYKLKREEYDAMLRECNGRCRVCKSPFSDIYGCRPCVDHCHKTGAVRGILCSSCNLTIARANDDPKILRACARYLERRATSVV